MYVGGYSPGEVPLTRAQTLKGVAYASLGSRIKEFRKVPTYYMYTAFLIRILYLHDRPRKVTPKRYKWFWFNPQQRVQPRCNKGNTIAQQITNSYKTQTKHAPNKPNSPKRNDSLSTKLSLGTAECASKFGWLAS